MEGPGNHGDAVEDFHALTATRSLSLSPGAVSQQLSALRHDVGVDLLRPDGRTVALTEAGRVLLEHADRILAAVEEAECAIAAVKGTVGATATLAALPSTVAGIVAPALTALGSHHPQLTVTCRVTDQAQLRELTLGTVDVVLGQRYPHGARRGPPDPAPPVRRDPSHRDREPDDHGRRRSAAHSRASGSHHALTTH
ncbi:LysR family transcriptional regulator [Streptomyces vilmorinianum]|uniref:LysR family transcriptional regulator n=1 Tax=Streptomyces vilmorinianum TaxID=3051092 RepID=UPI0010FB371A|nr:LysR family transcriptional regulator [Streptomyces vilmorinianum]